MNTVMTASAALAASIGAGLAGQQPSTFHADARLVVLHVTVTNRQGELVTNLDRDAFRVYEDGRPQPITMFRRDDVPISFGLIMDNSQSMRTLRSSVEAAALAFVRASNPLDEAFILNFADTSRIDVPLTRDVQALQSGIARLNSIGGTAVRDAIVAGEAYLREHAAYDRRALLVISDGDDNASTVSRGLLDRTVERNGAVVFAVSFNHEHTQAGEGRGADELEHLARVTGGVLRVATSASDVKAVVLELAHQIRNAYTIAYTPTNQALDGSYRSIRVKTTTRGLAVRARPGYWATPTPSIE